MRSDWSISLTSCGCLPNRNPSDAPSKPQVVGVRTRSHLTEGHTVSCGRIRSHLLLSAGEGGQTIGPAREKLEIERLYGHNPRHEFIGIRSQPIARVSSHDG